MSEQYDVIVIGLGAMGSATCHELARRGVRVLGIEQFGIPHSMGSYHSGSRVIRLCYYEHPNYVPLLYSAYKGWERLERDSGESLLNLTGGIYMGPEDCEFIQGTLRTAREHDLPHEPLTHAQLARRYPQFHLPEDHVGVYEPKAGYLLPEACICALVQLALRHGAEIHGQEEVLGWDDHESHISVRTQRATYEAGHVIFTAGAWTSKLLGDIGVELEVTRHVIGWVWPKKPELFELGTLPIWGIDDPTGYFYYGFPLMPGVAGMKIARHYAGRSTTIDTIDRTIHPADEDDFRPAISKLLPDSFGSLLSMGICLYTNSPDRHFIVDRHPDCPRAILAAGFSGHGFKFATVMGEILADLALDGRTDHPVDFLGLGRFADSPGGS